jgi:hypothetical protein
MRSSPWHKRLYAIAAFDALVSGLASLPSPWGRPTVVPPAYASYAWLIRTELFVLAAVCLVGIVAVFCYLTVRPKPWGKLICLVGLPWICFSSVEMLRLSVTSGPIFYVPLVPGVGGCLLLAIGVVLAAIDRKSTNSYG